MMIKLTHAKAKTLVRTVAGAALAGGLLALSGASSQASAQDSDTPLPGLWQYNYHAWVFSAGNETKCLSKADVQRFFDGLCNKGSKCTYSVNDAHDGKVKLEGLWIDHKGRRTKVSANGVYDQKSFKLNAHIVVAVLPIPVDGVIDGHFISANCPPGSEKPKKKA
jgi:hypothetical protein